MTPNRYIGIAAAALAICMPVALPAQQVPAPEYRSAIKDGPKHWVYFTLYDHERFMLNVEHGELDTEGWGPTWWSAQWQLEFVDWYRPTGSDNTVRALVRIRNRWTGGYLTFVRHGTFDPQRGVTEDQDPTVEIVAANASVKTLKASANGLRIIEEGAGGDGSLWSITTSANNLPATEVGVTLPASGDLTQAFSDGLARISYESQEVIRLSKTWHFTIKKNDDSPDAKGAKFLLTKTRSYLGVMNTAETLPVQAAPYLYINHSDPGPDGKFGSNGNPESRDDLAAGAVNIETGAVKASPIDAGWLSARWEQAGRFESGMTFKNVWTQKFLGVNGSGVAMLKAATGANLPENANYPIMWQVEGHGFGQEIRFAMRSLANGGFLNRAGDGSLILSPQPAYIWKMSDTVSPPQVQLFAPPAALPAPSPFVRLRNMSSKAVVNIEAGSAQLSPADDGWWSADWEMLEGTTPSGLPAVAFKNRWKGTYLSDTDAGLASDAPTERGNHFWRRMLDTDSHNGQVRLQNAATGRYFALVNNQLITSNLVGDPNSFAWFIDPH